MLSDRCGLVRENRRYYKVLLGPKNQNRMEQIFIEIIDSLL